MAGLYGRALALFSLSEHWPEYHRQGVPRLAMDTHLERRVCRVCDRSLELSVKMQVAAAPSWLAEGSRGSGLQLVGRAGSILSLVARECSGAAGLGTEMALIAGLCAIAIT